MICLLYHYLDVYCLCRFVLLEIFLTRLIQTVICRFLAEVTSAHMNFLRCVIRLAINVAGHDPWSIKGCCEMSEIVTPHRIFMTARIALSLESLMIGERYGGGRCHFFLFVREMFVMSLIVIGWVHQL